LKQVQALKGMGNYRQALALLQPLDRSIPLEPPSLEKVQVLRSLGDAYLYAYTDDSEFAQAKALLTQSLALATQLNLPDEISLAQFGLGGVLRVEIMRTLAQQLSTVTELDLRDKLPQAIELTQTLQAALSQFQQAGNQAAPIVAMQASLSQLRLLTDTLPVLYKFLAMGLDLVEPDFNQHPKFFLTQFLQGSPLSTQVAAQFPPCTELEPLPRLTNLARLRGQLLQLTQSLTDTLQQLTGPSVDALPASTAGVNARIHFARSLTQIDGVTQPLDRIDAKLRTRLQGIVAAQRSRLIAENARLTAGTPAPPAPKAAAPPQCADLAKAPEEAPAAPSAPRETRRSAPPRKLNPRVATALKALQPLLKASQTARLLLPETTYRSLQTSATAVLPQAALQLKRAIAEAQQIGNRRSETAARAALAELYGGAASQPSDWATVETLAQQTLVLAQTINAPDLAYRMQWLLARALRNQDKTEAARASCRVAANTLQSLRSDLVGISQDIQFTFRDSIDPVYRECVEVLLPSAQEAASQTTATTQRNLADARNLIESLQLAELDNFFREACINAQPVAIDQLLNPGGQQQGIANTAIIYPVVLPTQLSLIVATSNQTGLVYRTTTVERATVERTLANWRTQLLSTTSPAVLQTTAAQLYDWLIRPLEADLKGIDTLVFVMNSTFSNVPMAALYDGNQFLIQRFAIAISPGIHLFAPKPTAQQPINALAAGLVTIPPEFGQQNLPQTQQELDSLQRLGILNRSLVDAKFTSASLKQSISEAPFNVVHLSTHAEFSSQLNDTYILMADPEIKGRVGVKQFSTILQSRDRTPEQVIELLVLSACQTAKDDNRAVLGLAGIAIRSGARSTIASLWNADAEVAATLFDQFYQALVQQKATKAESLRVAQRALIQRGDAINQWAPYVLVGNWL
jgi:CHAT domain-containing protein